MLVTFDTSDLSEKGGLFYSTLVQGSKEAVRVQANESYQRIAKGSYWTNRSGRTLRSFSVRASGLSATVESRLKVAHFLNVGTRPHDIRPRKATALRFYWAKAGGMVSFSKVRHPGTKAKRYEHIETAIGQVALEDKTTTARDRAVERTGLG